MKIRASFVSNSSSASFILRTANLTDEQLSAIKERMEKEEADNLFREVPFYRLYLPNDTWDCIESTGEIHGDTFMDNGELEEWFAELDIPNTEWEIDDEPLD